MTDVFDVVHAKLLDSFPELVEGLGGNPDLLMQQAGIDPADRSEGASGSTYRQMIDLIELTAVALRCPDFGMRLATLQKGGGTFGPLGLAMKNSRTFGDALDYVGNHSYAHSLAARVWLKRSPADKSLFVGHDILLDRIPNKSQVMEQLLLAGHLFAMEMTDGGARVRKVHFRHQPVSSLRTYRRYFGCDVCFGQSENGVVFSEQDLACPIIGPDERAFQSVSAFIDAEFTRHRPPLHAQVRGIIMQMLGADQCRNDWVASELNLHSRTMHRRLKAEGTSFQQVKDEVRRDVMLYYLEQTNLDFAFISERLGFAEQSVMTRSCNRWLGASPTQIRSWGRNSTRSG